MKFLLPFLFSLLNAEAFNVVAPESSLDAWSHEAAIQRAKGFTKDLSTQHDTRIIGGSTSPAGRYPYFTYVEVQTSSDVFICSASLIWEDVILTAAHCILDIVGAGLTIASVEAFVGLENQNSRDSAEISQIGLSVPHPDYNSGTADNDIMLFKLLSPVLTIEPVQINFDAAVPAEGVGVGVDVIGFGATSTDPSVALPDALQVVSLSVIPFSECNDANSYNGALNRTVQMCAGTPTGGKDACDGDSGSPLIIPGADATGDVLVGLASFGQGCGNANFPGVYTRISTYQTFILDQLCVISDNKPLECDNSTAAPTTGAPAVSPMATSPSLPSSSPVSPVPLVIAGPQSTPTSSPTDASAVTPPPTTSSPTGLPTPGSSPNSPVATPAFTPVDSPTLAPSGSGITVTLTSPPPTPPPTSSPGSSPVMSPTSPVVSPGTSAPIPIPGTTQAPASSPALSPTTPVASPDTSAPVPSLGATQAPEISPALTPVEAPTFGPTETPAVPSLGASVGMGGMGGSGGMGGMGGTGNLGGMGTLGAMGGTGGTGNLQGMGNAGGMGGMGGTGSSGGMGGTGSSGGMGTLGAMEGSGTGSFGGMGKLGGMGGMGGTSSLGSAVTLGALGSMEVSGGMGKMTGRTVVGGRARGHNAGVRGGNAASGTKGELRKSVLDRFRFRPRN